MDFSANLANKNPEFQRTPNVEIDVSDDDLFCVNDTLVVVKEVIGYRIHVAGRDCSLLIADDAYEFISTHQYFNLQSFLESEKYRDQGKKIIQQLLYYGIIVKKRKYEIPFTFKRQNIEYLEEHVPDFKLKVKCIYLPAYFEHSTSTRQDNMGVVKNYPKTFEEYCSDIRYLQDRGYTVNVLLQDTERVMSEEIINIYINDLGIREFTVYLDETAKKIKQLCSEAVILASILKQLTVEDIETKDLSVYDYIVLDFRFNLKPEEVEAVKDKSVRYARNICINTIILLRIISCRVERKRLQMKLTIKCLCHI